MTNIILVRIDSRLIHGQITAQWQKALHANKIVVVNNEIAKDDFQQELMSMAAMGMDIEYKSVDDMIAQWKDLGPDLFVICENPQDVMKMAEGGVVFDKVNIGNMHMQKGKRQIATSVAVSDKDLQSFKALHERNIALEIRRLPVTPEEDSTRLYMD